MNGKIKLPLIICTAAICSCLILSATYGWFSTRDSVDNKFKAANLDTVIYEVFTPQTAWKPEIPVQKEIGVINSGTGAAIVRISLREYLLLLETGVYGDPTVQNLGTMAVAELDNPASWDLTGGLAVPASKYTDSGAVPMENENGPLYYKAAEILKSPNFGPENGRDPGISEYITLDWGSALGSDWYYNPEDSYFYYMKPLPGGSSTPRLLESVCLSGEYPNVFQFAPYFIEVNQESILADKRALTEQWNIPEASIIYQTLAPLLD